MLFLFLSHTQLRLMLLHFPEIPHAMQYSQKKIKKTNQSAMFCSAKKVEDIIKTTLQLPRKRPLISHGVVYGSDPVAHSSCSSFHLHCWLIIDMEKHLLQCQNVTMTPTVSSAH